MRLVVDASVVIQVGLAGGRLGPLARHHLLAPPLLESEVTSTLSEMSYRGELPPGQGWAALVAARHLPVAVERPERLYEDAWQLAQQLGWAKTYDAEYVALARHLNVPLVTTDERLRRGVGHLVHVPSIRDL